MLKLSSEKVKTLFVELADKIKTQYKQFKWKTNVSGLTMSCNKLAVILVPASNDKFPAVQVEMAGSGYGSWSRFVLKKADPDKKELKQCAKDIFLWIYKEIRRNLLFSR